MEAHTPHQPIRRYNRSLYDAPSDWSSINGLDQWAINRNGPDGRSEAIEHFRGLYAAAIDYLDRKVATFIELIRATTDRETTFVITSDHGENLGYPADDGMIGHTSSLSEGLLHVPLTLVNSPDEYATIEQEYVSHTELGSLISGLANGRTPDVAEERIAAERITTTNAPNVEADEQHYWQRMLRCVYGGDQKWLWDSLETRTEYDIDPERPNWQQQISGKGASIPEWADEFFTESIKEFQRQDPASAQEDLDDVTKSRLEELGYL